MIIEPGEKIHLVERRFFSEDMHRHFIGEVRAVTDNALRITGFVWVYNSQKNVFVRRPEKRERLLPLGDRLIINILPKDVAVDDVIYDEDLAGMFITDGKKFRLDLSEFAKLK